MKSKLRLRHLAAVATVFFKKRIGKKVASKTTTLETFVKRLLAGQPNYCLSSQRKSHGKNPSNLNTIFFRPIKRMNAWKHINFLYKSSTGEITITFFEKIYSAHRDRPFMKKQTLLLAEANPRVIRKEMQKWFTEIVTEKPIAKVIPLQKYEIKVSFITDFPLFAYRKKFCINRLPDDHIIDEIVYDIFQKEIKQKPRKELQQFLAMYKTPIQMVYHTVKCSIKCLHGDEAMENTEKWLSTVFGEKLHERISVFIIEKPITIKQKRRLNLVKFFHRLMGWDTKPSIAH